MNRLWIYVIDGCWYYSNHGHTGRGAELRDAWLDWTRQK